MTKSILTIAIATVLATSAGSALAANNRAGSQTVSTIVRYGDLNIESPEGAHALLFRIKSAARRVCDPEPTSMVELDDWRTCMAKATEDAVARTNSPMVTAAFTGKPAGSVHLAQNTPR